MPAASKVQQLAERHGVPVQGMSLWGEKFPERVLRRRHAAEPRSFDRGMRHLGYTEGELHFPTVLDYVEVGQDFNDLGAEDFTWFAGLDISSPKRPGNFLVGVGLDARRHRHVFEETVAYGKWSTRGITTAIDQMDSVIHADAWIVESNGVQSSIVEGLREDLDDHDWAARVHGRNTGGRDHMPADTYSGDTALPAMSVETQVGIPSMDNEFQSGLWHFHYKTAHSGKCTCGLCVLMEQLALHPTAPVNDGVMALYFARCGIVRFSSKGLDPVDMSDVMQRAREMAREERGEDERTELERFLWDDEGPF